MDRDEAWAVLGVSPEASEDEIRHAWRELVRRFHPDRVSHLGSEFAELARVRMVRINEAYDLLATDVDLDDPVTDEILPDDETVRTAEPPTLDDPSFVDPSDPAEAPTESGFEPDALSEPTPGRADFVTRFQGATATLMPIDEGRLDPVTTWVPEGAHEPTESDPPSVGLFLSHDEPTRGHPRIPFSFVQPSDGPPTLILDHDGPTRWASDGPPTIVLDLPDVIVDEVNAATPRVLAYATRPADDVDLGEPEDG